MSSQRFPGKVLHKISGKPMLQYLLERLRLCRSTNDIIVATSTEESDDAIEIFCKRYGVKCYRGSLSDVAGRFKAVLDSYPCDAFVRVNGDSPLLDQRLIDKGIDIFLNEHFDMVTNALVRTHPKGQSVEILRSDIFCDAYGKMRESEDLEHVTKYFYKNQNNFKIFNFESGKNLGGIQLSVDTPDDMAGLEKIVNKMDRPHWEYTFENILDIL